MEGIVPGPPMHFSEASAAYDLSTI